MLEIVPVNAFKDNYVWTLRDAKHAAVVDPGEAGPVLQKGTTPYWEIQALDVTGDAASVKVVDDYADLRFTDYLSLLKISGRWSIINKLYDLHD